MTNVLTARQTKHEWYIYKGVLNTLRGFWEVGMD